ncbi:S8 family peptidase [candidate division KSB1 bacterium]|nr:S8 family peptidase [candidate division KSB1 bacterium]
MNNFCTRKIYSFVLLLVLSTWAMADDGPQHYWFYFTDKGPVSLKKDALKGIESGLSQRVKWRRAKMATGAPLVDETDLPVYKPYLDELADLGIQPRTVSRWLNAVAAPATADQMAAAHRLSCIKNIRPVITLRKGWPEGERLLERSATSPSSDPLNYGAAFTQNDLIQIPAVHQMGYYGQGVRIAVFDTGFRLNHEAFDSLRVIARYDFIYRDDYTDNEPEDDPDQNRHGSQVLSILAGYAPGQLIGPAFRAEYLLAKTEDTGQEIRAEEDHWVAAAEWAEGMGADIITSSLGYNDWYTYNDMDGETAAITLAADLAVTKGIVVLSSAGNEGNSSWRYITAPADGKYVIAVGAVDATATIASFSSHGPTADGRIKPDIVAMGLSVTSISVPAEGSRGTAYTRISGTSASCPLAAGAVALLLNANPELNPLKVRYTLMQTSTLHDQPDNVYGYGLIQAASALQYWQDTPAPVQMAETFRCETNPYSINSRNPMRVTFVLPGSAFVQIKLFNLLGQELGIVWQRQMSAGAQMIFLNGAYRFFRTLGSGIYFLQLEAAGQKQLTKITLLQ